MLTSASRSRRISAVLAALAAGFAAIISDFLLVAFSATPNRQLAMRGAWNVGRHLRETRKFKCDVAARPRYSFFSSASLPGPSATGTLTTTAATAMFALGALRYSSKRLPRDARALLGTTAQQRQLHLQVCTRQSVEIITEEVRKPATDEASYRVLKLRNGLQVLLCSDPSADFAGAALSVRCGTFQDPEELPGLAHFHEHMLFLGTEKFPAEDEYSKFLNEHGGDSNAYTMNEFTTYYFKVAAPHLVGALDRFSQFFVAPTFDPSCVEREMKAVDSESTNYSTDDGWRMLQIQKSTVSSEHPFHRFDVGNLSTLGADDPPRTRSQLISWNQEHYQAGAMKLVVSGRESLAELQETVQQQFGPVRGGSGVQQQYKTLPWNDEQLGRIVYVVPVKQNRSISINWPLPPKSEYPFAKPELYISHVLGHEGSGSLHDILNHRGWVDQLAAGPSNSFSDGQLFTVSITLTPEGDEHRDEVLALLFEYLALVQRAGPQEATFRELAAMQEIAFAHKEDAPAPDDFASTAAHSLFHYPPEEAMRGPFAVDQWLPDVVTEYMQLLQPERCIIFVSSPVLADEAFIAGREADLAHGWHREKWYRAPHREEAINAARIDRWRMAAGEGSGLKLPEPNPFIPQDFTLRGTASASTPETSRAPVEVTAPALIVSKPLLRMWHKIDCAFASPREYVLVHVHTPAYESGPETVAMMRLFCNIVYDDLNSFAYDASIAGLGYSLEYADSLSLSVFGFSDKLPQLLKVLAARLGEVLLEAEAASAENNADDERAQELMEKLETQREILLVDYRNFTREEPWSVSNYYVGQIMIRNSWHLDEYVDVLKSPASLVSLAAAVRPAFKQLQAECFVHGNASAEEARGVADILENAFTQLGAEPLPETPRREVTKLPLGTTIFQYNLAAQNPAQENCCTQNIYQVGVAEEDVHRAVCLVVVGHIAGTSAYEKLRTKEQLGYIVQAWCWTEQYICGLGVLVQGPRLPPKEVDKRIEAWLDSFGTQIEEMTAEDFATYVQAVKSERTQRYARMAQETTRHWAEIQSRRYRFDRLSKSVAVLEALKKDDIVSFFKEYLAKGAPQRRKLSMQILGTSAGSAEVEQDDRQVKVLGSLQEIRDFKAACEIFPMPAAAEAPGVGI